MSIGLIVTYRSLFNEKSNPNVGDLVRNIPSRSLVQYLCSISARLHRDPNGMKTQRDLVAVLLKRQPKKRQVQLASYLYSRNILSKQWMVFDISSVLSLTAEVCNSFNDLPFAQSTPEIEWRVFKALLVNNEKLDQIKSPDQDFHIDGITWIPRLASDIFFPFSRRQ